MATAAVLGARIFVDAVKGKCPQEVMCGYQNPNEFQDAACEFPPPLSIQDTFLVVFPRTKPMGRKQDQHHHLFPIMVKVSRLALSEAQHVKWDSLRASVSIDARSSYAMDVYLGWFLLCLHSDPLFLASDSAPSASDRVLRHSDVVLPNVQLDSQDPVELMMLRAYVLSLPLRRHLAHTHWVTNGAPLSFAFPPDVKGTLLPQAMPNPQEGMEWCPFWSVCGAIACMHPSMMYLWVELFVGSRSVLKDGYLPEWLESSTRQWNTRRQKNIKWVPLFLTRAAFEELGEIAAACDFVPFFPTAVCRDMAVPNQMSVYDYDELKQLQVVAAPPRFDPFMPPHRSLASEDPMFTGMLVPEDDISHGFSLPPMDFKEPPKYDLFSAFPIRAVEAPASAEVLRLRKDNALLQEQLASVVAELNAARTQISELQKKSEGRASKRVKLAN
jgi:hypothetical protein